MNFSIGTFLFLIAFIFFLLAVAAPILVANGIAWGLMFVALGLAFSGVPVTIFKRIQ